MDLEQKDFQETFDGQKGSYFFFLKGFTFDKDSKCIFYQEDSTETLPENVFEDFRKFHKQCKQDCFECYEDSDVHAKVLFFLQKLSQLNGLGFPNSTERRWTYHWVLANLHA